MSAREELTERVPLTRESDDWSEKYLADTSVVINAVQRHVLQTELSHRSSPPRRRRQILGPKHWFFLYVLYLFIYLFIIIIINMIIIDMIIIIIVLW